MQIGMIGLGRMGASMVRRLLAGGHECVVYDHSASTVDALERVGAIGACSLNEFVDKLSVPRRVWIMVPAGVVDRVMDQLTPLLQAGDVLIDGGNSHFKEDIARAERLAQHGIQWVDVGTSGGVHGAERGYCLMIGGGDAVVESLAPVFRTLAPGFTRPRTAGREGPFSPPEEGWLHCGPSGAGHFVKMVHNGIEYGLMAAYAEGFNILAHAGVGNEDQATDAETAPMAGAAAYRYDIDIAAVSEVWRRGSVIGSWLLDLTAEALHHDPRLDGFSGVVADSGEGRWAAMAALETGTPAPVLATALFDRFMSRGEAGTADKLLSAMRLGFGGHFERAEGASGEHD